MKNRAPRISTILAAITLTVGAGVLAVMAAAPATPKPAATAPALQPGQICMARQTGPGATYPDRYDDIFWENDRIAHRIYGPALMASSEHLIASGIDIWVKNVRTPFMDKQLSTGKQHDNHGEGMDCYDTGTTRGCGGLGIWDDTSKKLFNSQNWAENKILQNGPNVASFWVKYKDWDVGDGRTVSEERTFTLPAGTNFTRLVSTFKSNKDGDLLVGIGITKRKADGTRFKGEDTLVSDKDHGIMAYWEPEQFNQKDLTISFGHIGTAVIFDPKSFVKFVTDDPDQNLVILKVTPGKPWAYYAGACWSLGLDFHTQPEWEKYARDFKPNFDAAAK